MLLLGLFGAVGKISKHLLPAPVIDVKCYLECSKGSYFIASFLTVVFAHPLTVSLFVCLLQADFLRKILLLHWPHSLEQSSL